MSNKINIEIFKFNYEQDYLPYYKQYTLEYKADDTVDSLLENIDSLEKLKYEKSRP